VGKSLLKSGGEKKKFGVGVLSGETRGLPNKTMSGKSGRLVAPGNFFHNGKTKRPEKRREKPKAKGGESKSSPLKA